MLSISGVNVILPAIRSGISATDSQIQWVLAGYTLAFGVTLVPAGRAGDVYGRGWLFVGGLSLFALGSLGSGLASNGTWLDAARLVMGFGSGMINPQIIGTIQNSFSGGLRARAFGSFGVAVGLSVSVGPLLSGVLISALGAALGWRISFLINVPVAIIVIVLVLRRFPADSFKAKDSDKKADLDPVGVSLFSAAILLIMLPFLERGYGTLIFSALVIGLALLIFWVRWEVRYAKRGGEPMVKISLFKVPSFAFGAALIGLQFTGVTSIFVILAIYFQEAQGFSALTTALVGLPSAIATGYFSNYAGRRVLQRGRKLVAVGVLVVLFSLLTSMAVVWAHLTFGLTPWWLMLTMAFLGAGQGLVVSPNQTLTMLEVPPKDSGAAGGILQTGQRVGSSIGVAFITAAFFVLQTSHGWDIAFLASFGLVTLTVLAAFIVASAEIISTKRRQQTSGNSELG